MMKQSLGSCCKELRAAMTEAPNSFFRVEENGVFYLTIGMTMTEDGPGFFDQALFYCPFCGTRLQDREEILKASQN